MEFTGFSLALALLFLVASPAKAVQRSPHTPVWFDLTVHDVADAESFYSSVFGWQFAPTQGKYTLIEDGGTPIGGLYLQPKSPVSGGASVYFHVSDLSGALSRAKEHGAILLFGPRSFPGGEVMALFQDPDGNHVGLMQ